MNKNIRTAIKMLEVAEVLDQMGMFVVADSLENHAARIAQQNLKRSLGDIPGLDIFTDDKIGALSSMGTSIGFNTEPYQRAYGPSLGEMEASGAMPNPYEDGKSISELVRQQQQWMRGKGNPYYGPMLQADSALQAMYARMLKKLAYYDDVEKRGGRVPEGYREKAKQDYESYAARVEKKYQQGTTRPSGASKSNPVSQDAYLKSIGYTA